MGSSWITAWNLVSCTGCLTAEPPGKPRSHQFLSQALMTQGRPGRQKLFHKQEASRGQAGRDLSQEVPRGSRTTLNPRLSLGGTQARNSVYDHHVPWLPVVRLCLPSADHRWCVPSGLTAGFWQPGLSRTVRAQGPRSPGFGSLLSCSLGP